MLFEDNKFQSLKYEFDSKVDLSQTYSFYDVSLELNRLTEKLQTSLINQEEVYLHVKDRTGKKVRLKWLNEGLKEETFNRNNQDILNIICQKKEFRKRLESIGIVEEKDKGSINFVYYLQCVYFFYILIYFVFPNVKFMDLFKEKNWSTENTLECETGNEIYEDLIIQNIYENKEWKEKYMHRIQEYDDSWNAFCNCFFSYYELNYYAFINVFYKDYFVNWQEVTDSMYEEFLQDTYSYELTQYYQDFIKEELNIEIEVEDYKRNVFDSFFDFDLSYNSQTLNQDYLRNIKEFDYASLLKVYDSIQRIPTLFDSIKVYESQYKEILEDSNFIQCVMNVDYLTNTIRKKYKDYHLDKIVQRIIDYEKAQLKFDVESVGFTFLKKDKEYFLTMADLAIVCMVKVYMPYQLTYTCKRMDLENRSDANKSLKHSVKESFKSIGGSKNSIFRDSLFLILCRMMKSMYETKNPKEFLYYEVPMNTLIYEIMDREKEYLYLEQRTSYYKQMKDYMEGEIQCLENQ